MYFPQGGNWYEVTIFPHKFEILPLSQIIHTHTHTTPLFISGFSIMSHHLFNLFSTKLS